MDRNFYHYKAWEVAKALKRFLGCGINFEVRWLFLDGDTILVRFLGEWIPVWFGQVEKYLPCED